MARGRPRTSYVTPVGSRLINQEYFLQHQQPGPNGCIVWTGTTNNIGYGFIGFRNSVTDQKGMMTTHRLALMLKLGRDLQPGMNANHSCNNRLCCNPDHLSEGTQQQKIADMIRADVYPLTKPENRHRRPRDINSYRYSVEEIQWGRRATLDELQQRYNCTRRVAYRYRFTFRNTYPRVPD